MIPKTYSPSYLVAAGVLCLATLFASSSTLAQSVLDSELEDFLSLPAGALDALSFEQTELGGDVTSGSALQTTFTVQAGDTLEVSYRFLTEELPPAFFGEDDFIDEGDFDFTGDGDFDLSAVAPGIIVDIGDGPIDELNFFDDFAFVSIGIDGVLDVIASVNASDFGTGAFVPALDAFGVVFPFQTDVLTLEHTFGDDGEASVGLGVVDVGDFFVDSVLVVESVLLNGALVAGADIAAGDISAFEGIGDFELVDLDIEFPDLPDGLAALTEPQFALVATTAGVPEPSSAALVFLAGVAATGLRRQR